MTRDKFLRKVEFDSRQERCDIFSATSAYPMSEGKGKIKVVPDA
jgi:hypothetical protein